MENIINSEQPKHFVQRRRRSIITDYLVSASTHGLRSVGRAYSTCNLFFWLVVFLVTLGLMCYFVVSAILQYFAYPTQTNVNVRLDLSMDFPAVTICSGNPNRYDKMNTSLVNFFYRFNPPNATFNQTLLNSLAVPLYIDLFNRNQTEEWQSIGFQLSDMLLTCTYNGIDCSNAFIPSMSSILGNCYTFNWKSSTNFVTLANFSGGFVLREGLSMAFYMPQEIYFPTTFYDNGLLLLLRDNDELPLPNENGLSLHPGLSHSITYRKRITTFLPSPYTQCTSAVNDDLRSLYRTTFLNQTASDTVAYSESICRQSCEQAYTYSQCSCILPLPFFQRQVLKLDGQLVSVNGCNALTNQLACAFNAKKQFSTSNQLQTLWCTHCAPQCEHTDFTTDLSALSAPSEADKEYWNAILLNETNPTSLLVPADFAQNFDYYFERNYMKVLVTCGSKYITEYKQEAKLSFVDTFSAVGGQTGLWIGMSALSVIELAELFYRLVYRRIILFREQDQIYPMTTTVIINNR